MKKEEQNKETIQLSFMQLYSAVRGLDKEKLNLMTYLLLCEKKISVNEVLSRLYDANETMIEKERCLKLDACNCLNRILSYRNISTKKDGVLFFLKRSIYLIKHYGNLGSVSKIEKRIGYDDKTDLEMKKFIEDIYDIKL